MIDFGGVWLYFLCHIIDFGVAGCISCANNGKIRYHELPHYQNKS